MNKRKIALISASIMIVAAIICTYFYFTPISKNIDVVVTSIQFRMPDSPDDYELKEITIKGTTHHFLFGNKTDYYEGWFTIEGYDYTFKCITFFGLSTSYSLLNILWYTHPDPPNILGNIYTTDLEEFIIYVYEVYDDGQPEWDYDISFVICAPASNREEAGKIVERLAAPEELFPPGDRSR